MSVQVVTYFGDSTNDLENQISDLIERGGKIQQVSIAYGPTPARAAGLPYSGLGWHAFLIYEWPDGTPVAQLGPTGGESA